MEVRKVAPWQQRDSDGYWHRPLLGAEKMFDEWLLIDGWCEWVASIKFSDKKLDQSILIKKDFQNAVASLCLDMPSLLTSIDRLEKPKGPFFLYRPLIDINDLMSRVSEIAEVVKLTGPLDAGVKEITDCFYSDTAYRISIELGPNLVQFKLVFSTLPEESGMYVLLLRSHHSLNDFLSGMGIFDRLLTKLATRQEPDQRLLADDVKNLHPCYLDLLRDSIDHFSASEEELSQGTKLINEHLNNITYWPNEQECAASTSTTDYAVRRLTHTTETTSRLIAICKEHGVTVTALLLAVQTVAMLITFPPEDEDNRVAKLNLVSNRSVKTTLSDVAVDETATEKGSEKGISAGKERITKANKMGPIMATNFFLANCDVGDYIDVAKSHKKNQDDDEDDDVWRKSIWKVASKVKQTLKEAEPQSITEKAYWTEGPTGFGLVTIALDAMKSGNAPIAPGVFTSLSAPGLLDDIHLQPKYGNSLFLEDVAFYPRVSTFFGGQTWAWTALGKLNSIVVLPDPRKCKSKGLEWWDLNNRIIKEVALGNLKH